ncbi:MAG: ATP synthase F1 subunit gamma [Ruminococcus sp.]|jgi:F-type H+-transporting ATPase subunit gamma|nr:ATP synthase F1 subunit gamma [Ruminococcus sp.]MBR4021537.1 ATP synthase F1 subunit gamma [Ruminococcus sp.]
MASGNMKEIKRRIKSVESTMQITKAMELVASSKFRKAKEKADSAMTFFNAVYETMSEIASQDRYFNSVYTRKSTSSDTSLIIVIAGDRGLAGGYNSNVIKLAEARIAELGGNAVIMPIGKKAVEYFTKHDAKILKGYEGIAENMSLYNATEIADIIIDMYNKHKSIGHVELVYTEYVSPLVQNARTLSVIPLSNLEEQPKCNSVTRYEPSPSAVFEQLIPKYIAGIIYGAAVCSFASEQASRRMAMENATDNATEIIDNLSLIYNRARQTAITQEITEIVGGASAQN